MIKREVINKIESLSKESACWNRYQCDDAYRCLENHKRCVKALYIWKKDDPTGERRFELNLFLHGLLELDGIKYYQKRDCITAEVKASGYSDICFTFNNAASYTSFKHLVAAAYGDLNKFFELEV